MLGPSGLLDDANANQGSARYPMACDRRKCLSSFLRGNSTSLHDNTGSLYSDSVGTEWSDGGRRGDRNRFSRAREVDRERHDYRFR